MKFEHNSKFLTGAFTLKNHNLVHPDDIDELLECDIIYHGAVYTVFNLNVFNNDYHSIEHQNVLSLQGDT